MDIDIDKFLKILEEKLCRNLLSVIRDKIASDLDELTTDVTV